MAVSLRHHLNGIPFASIQGQLNDADFIPFATNAQGQSLVTTDYVSGRLRVPVGVNPAGVWLDANADGDKRPTDAADVGLCQLRAQTEPRQPPS